MRDAVRLMLQELIEAEAAGAIGAVRYERSEARVTERNRHRARLLSVPQNRRDDGRRPSRGPGLRRLPPGTPASTAPPRDPPVTESRADRGSGSYELSQIAVVRELPHAMRRIANFLPLNTTFLELSIRFCSGLMRPDATMG